ncbi:centriolar coiled-coil protein of 110 kDa isoform X3 [Tiliqua scincoides]
MKMENYEKFCEKHRARIREEVTQSSMPLSAQPSSIPCIRFNGVPVLTPLLTLEKKQELQQDRQKALDVELWRQNSRKRILLHRVQEILENVQMKKSPNPSDLDQSEMENVCSGLDSINGFVTQSNDVLPSCPAAGEPMEPQKALEAKPTDLQVVSGKNSLGGNEQLVSGNGSSISGNGDSSLAGSANAVLSNEASEQESVEMVSAAEEGPDPYVMSLQNLLKKSREYIQREQTRRSMRANSKRSMSESHSDKENDAVKMGNSVKERGKLTGRGSVAVALEKPALTRSSTSLQGAPLSKNSTGPTASPSFSKVDIPVRSGTPPVLDSDSDDDLKTICLFDRDSSILRSLTGSYSKLPSPEPSMSPKMHRRRPRPSSMGHIVINNPINAYELSPKDKERAADGVIRDVGDKRTASDPVPRLVSDLASVCSHRDHAFHKSSSDISDELVVRKLGHSSQVLCGQRETKGFPAGAIAEGEQTLDGPRPNACLVNPTLLEPHASSYPIVTQNSTSVGAAKQAGLLHKAKPTELNKSYDVESPSPLLMQIQPSLLTDTPSVSPGSEQALENGFEKVKRRLELDMESLQKESMPGAVGEGAGEQEKQPWLREQRGSVGSAFAAKHETPDRSTCEEEALKQKMLAFEEMKKRLEAQHVHQLSLLIAEQEREQERLHKEIEMQERRLKGEEATAAKTDAPQTALNSGMELGWRKVSDTQMLESVLTQVGAIQSAGFTSVTGPGLAADTPFYLWEPPASGKSVSASRSLNRSKMRWSQVYSPEMKRKLDKISALAKGFLTRRLLQTEKLKHLSQTVKDTMEFIKNFQSEAPLKRGAVSAQDANLQERVVAQLRAALYDIHDIFFKMDVTERMNILRHDREVRKEKMLRQLDKARTLRERVTLSTATQKSLDRKKYMKYVGKRAAEMGMPNKKTIVKQKTPENRVLQPNQGQNAPIQRLLSRQGTPKTSVKGAEQTRKKPSESRVPNKALSGAYAGRIPKKKLNAVTT